MLTLDTIPDDCLNGADDCLKIGFTTDNLVESVGSLVKAIISETDASDFQVGTTIAINGVKFTLAGSSDFDTNEITYSATESDMLVNIATVFSGNYYILKNYTIFINGTDLELTPKKATLQTNIAYTNLSGATPEKEISFDPDPVVVRPGYSVKVSLIDDDSTEELAEVRIYALPTPTADLTDIDSHVIEKDVSGIVKSYLSSPLPSIDTVINPPIFKTNDSIRKIRFDLGEVYGTPLNQYKWIQVATPFAVLNGGSRKGFDLSDYCDSLLNIEESGVNITCDQVAWLYRYIANPTDYQLSYNVEFFSPSGASLGSKIISSVTNEAYYLFAMQVGLPQLAGELANAPVINIQDIASYTVTVNYRESGILVDTDTFTFNVINAPDNECFVYKTSLGTFSSISTQGLNARTLEVAREFIELCTPCTQTVTTKSTETTSLKRTLALTFNLFNNDVYQNRQLEEFFSSREVYWRSGGELYHVQPQNDNTQLYQRKSNLNPVFNARLYY